MSGRGHQLIHSDALSAELEALGLDSSLFGAAGIPAPIFQALVTRRAGVFDEHANTFGTVNEPASFTRASNGIFLDAAGDYQIAADHVIRAEYSAAGAWLGYLFEPASTNDFLSSDAAATQDIALGTGTFTCSVHGAGSVTSSDGTGTASGHGAATDGLPNTIVVSGAGTITYTVSGSPTYVQVEELSVPTSPIITAGIAATRAIDQLLWAVAPSGFSHIEGMAMVSLSYPSGYQTQALARPVLSLRNASGPSLIHIQAGATQKWRTTDGTNVADVSPAGGNLGVNERATIVTRWGPLGLEIGCHHAAGGWNWSGVVPFDGAFLSDSRFQVLRSLTFPAHIADVRLWNRCLTTTQIQAMIGL